MRSLLAAQQTFVDKLVQLMKAVQRESGNRKKKVTTHLCQNPFRSKFEKSGTKWRVLPLAIKMYGSCWMYDVFVNMSL